jgi:predicted TIM-barrel fold metal-dependent hydrolase
MIIDSHVHLLDQGWVHDDYMLGMARVAIVPMGRATGEYPDASAIVQNLLPVLADPTGEKLIATMDAAGVDMSCIFTVDYGLATGEPPVSIEEQNRVIAEAAARYPDRLIPFFTIDPRREGASEMFARAIRDWGVKGLKLHPTSGYFPYDDFCYPLYEKCAEHGLPVLFHTGSQPSPLKCRYTQPINVDDVAADFPELPVIMAHVGHALWEEALFVASVKPNIYFDISGWQIAFNSHPQDFYRMLRKLLDDVGPWRVFFGTDGPYLNVVCPLDRWVQALCEPDLSSCPEVSFTTEEMEIVTGKAFAKLLGLES